MANNNPQALMWNQRGLELAEQGLLREAWEAYSQALALDPQNGAIYYNRAALLMEGRQYEQAIADFTQALRLIPGDAEALGCRGECYGKLGRDQEALADFMRALATKPLLYRTWGSRGVFHSERANWSQALADWQQARRLAPERPRYWYLVGRALAELGRYDEALPYLDRAMELGESDPLVYTWRGFCREGEGDDEGALADYGIALQRQPTNVTTLTFRANLQSNRGAVRQAFDDYSSVILQGGDGDFARLKRGELFLQAGRHAEAWADFDAALRFNPECRDVYRLRARLLRQAGHFDQAEAEARRLDELALAGLRRLSASSEYLSAAVLQANGRLYEPGDTDEFCFVLFSFDPAWSGQPARLQALASILKMVKGTTPVDPNMRRIADMISDERAVEYRRRVLPTNVTEGATIYYADLLVYRRFLAGGILEPGAIVRILAEPGEQGRLELSPPT